MTVLFPEATPSHLNEKVVIVDSLVTVTSPKLTELNATTSLDVSCFIRAWNPEITPNSGSAPDRLCSAVTLPQEGKTAYGAIPMNYVYDPQGDPASNDNKAFTKLVQGLELFAVVRKGLPFSTAWAIGDKAEVWKVRLGRQNRVKSGDDEFAEFEIAQMLYPMSEVKYGVVVA